MSLECRFHLKFQRGEKPRPRSPSGLNVIDSREHGGILGHVYWGLSMSQGMDNTLEVLSYSLYAAAGGGHCLF